MKIAIAQLNPTIGDLSGNSQRILEAAQQAAAQGARLVLTPELSLCGYPPRDLLMHPGFVESMATTLAQLAKDLPPQLAVLVGTVEVNPNSLLEGGKPLFNSMALLEGGKIQQIFYKRLLPTYDVFDEDRYFEPGKQPNHFVLHLQADAEAGSDGDAETRRHEDAEISSTQNSEPKFLLQKRYPNKTLPPHPSPLTPHTKSTLALPSAKISGTMRNFGANGVIRSIRSPTSPNRESL